MRTRRQTLLAVVLWTPLAVFWLLGLVAVALQLKDEATHQPITEQKPLDSSELYDPASMRWLPGGRMTTTHERHKLYAVEGGALLLASSLFEAPMAERFDAKSGTFKQLDGPLPRRSQPARLRGGRLLFPLAEQRSTAVVFDFATNTSTLTAPYVHGRCVQQAQARLNSGSPADDAARSACLGDGSMASAVELADGRALAVIGADAQVYDPATNAWTEIAPPPTGRANVNLRRLASGKILAFGGYTLSPLADPHATELYDATTDSWRALSPTHGFYLIASDTLTDDRIFAVGSEGAELFARGEWRLVPKALTSCEVKACTYLASGELIMLGGAPHIGAPRPFDFATPSEPFMGSGPAPSAERVFAAAVTLTDGRVLLSGGEKTVLVPWLRRWLPALTDLGAAMIWVGLGVLAARLPSPRFRPPLLALVGVCAVLALLATAGYVWLMWAMTGAITG